MFNDATFGFWLYRRPYFVTPTGRQYLVYSTSTVYRADNTRVKMSALGSEPGYLVPSGRDQKYFEVYNPLLHPRLQPRNLRLEGRPLTATDIRKNEFKAGMTPDQILTVYIWHDKFFQNIVIPPVSNLPLFFLDSEAPNLKPFFQSGKKITLPAGTEVYHGGQLTTLQNKPLWVALEESVARKYGEVTTLVTTTELEFYVLDGDNYERFKRLSRAEDYWLVNFFYSKVLPCRDGRYCRDSSLSFDSMFAGLLCLSGLAGYYAEALPQLDGTLFHAEMMVCSPVNVLRVVE